MSLTSPSSASGSRVPTSAAAPCSHRIHSCLLVIYSLLTCYLQLTCLLFLLLACYVTYLFAHVLLNSVVAQDYQQLLDENNKTESGSGSDHSVESKRQFAQQCGFTHVQNGRLGGGQQASQTGLKRLYHLQGSEVKSEILLQSTKYSTQNTTTETDLSKPKSL